MGILSGLFGNKSKFNDTQIVSQATTALDVDPMVSDPGALVVTSDKGVVTVSGVVQREREKERIEGVIHNALTTTGIKHERIVNNLKMSQGISRNG